MTRRTEHLIEAQIPALRRYAYALLRDRDAADDLVQECLLRALSRWHLFRPEAALRPWLFRVLHNIYIDGLRVRARRGGTVPLDSAPEPGVPGRAEAVLEAQAVFAAIDRLPEDQRAILLLIGVEDFSYEDAAKILQVPKGTLMSRLARARAALREMTGRGEDGSRPGLRRVK